MFPQVSTGILGLYMRQYEGRNNGGPTGCVNTLPDLDQHHLSERKCRP